MPISTSVYPSFHLGRDYFASYNFGVLGFLKHFWYYFDSFQTAGCTKTSMRSHVPSVFTHHIVNGYLR